MKYFRRDLKSNENINRKYAKNYQHNMNIITFLKSNYKYKRRCTKCNKGFILQQRLPVPEENIRIRKKISLSNTKFSKILRIIILILQQATPNINNTNNVLLTQLVVRMKRTKKHMKKNDAMTYLASDRDDDGIGNNHQAHKDANEDTDTNVDISNISDEISHQQHRYDKVSTITSTPLRCQKQNHHQIKATKSSSFSPSSTPSILASDVQENYETCQWSDILRHYLHGNLLSPQHHHHHAMHKNSMSAGSELGGNNYSDSSTGTSTSSVARTARICQSVDQYVSATGNSSYTLSGLLLTLFIAFTFGVRCTTAGACWQTVLDNGKCNEMFSLNISKSECCGANQEFAYTDREPTNVEYFFATAIGGGMECSPCLESCKNVKCGPNKKCVKRKGRPKCICAPECGAARRKRKHREHLMQQHHTFLMDASGAKVNSSDAAASTSNAFKIKLEKSQQSRESRSLSSEITNINLGLIIDKDAANSRITSLVDRHHHREHNQNQRKLIHIHMREHEKTKQKQSDNLLPLTHQQQIQQPNHKNQEPKEIRRLLITANVELTEKPTTRRLQILSNVRTTHARRHNSNSNKNYYHEDTDPSDYDEDDENAYGADDDGEEAKKSSTTTNNNNRNDDATRFLNQSLSRHQLKMNTKPNNNRNKTQKNNHDIQTTKLQQHSDNNTRVRHPHHNGRHAENTPHHRHHHRHQHNHQQQQHRHHHQQHRHGRQKNNKQKHKHQKNNTDYNTTMTTIVVSSLDTATPSHNTLHNSSDIDAAAIATAIAVSSTIIKNTVLSLSSPSSVTTTVSTASQDTQSLPQLLSSSATPVNSSISATNFTAAADADADTDAVAFDSYHNQHLLNHGSKIPTSSSLSTSAILSATAQSDSAFQTTMSAKDEVVSLRRHQDRSEATTKNNNTNNDNRISSLNSYSDKIEQQLLQQTQKDQHHQIPLFDGVADQFALHGFLNKQHTIKKNGDNLRPTNPVCGTDGRTYNTECQLRKRACRTDNTNLKVAYRGHCKTTCSGVKCINGLTCVEDQYSMPHCIVCKIECPQDYYDNDVVDATRAVCGADGNTYKNTCDINRMICEIGRSIGVAYPGPCREDQVTCDDINCGPKQVCLIDLLTHKPRCTTCRYKCSRKRRPSQLRFEEGKICGVNNRAYNSWCEMRKDSCSTGFHIAVKYSGDCH